MPYTFKSILFFLLLLLSLTGVGQIFPVQVTTQLSRPYSLYLSDYTAPGSERIAVNIFLTDVSRTDLNIRLRLRIEGQGIKIETKPEFVPPLLTLHGGAPLQLISSDLADYFEPRNLNFSGISQREYEQKGSLPEGFYQFCFEVYEFNRNVKISNSSCASAWLILNDPPLINLPRDNEKVRIQSPQQVIFQWTPRHTGSPNAAFTTEYDFKLVEIWPSTRNPNDAILTSPPIYETTTTSTTLIYGAAETALEPGRRYAFQIKAHSIAGTSELNLFKNNGLSQVSSFVFGDACLPPLNIIADAAGATRFTAKWDEGLGQTAYNLRYRLAQGGEWYTTNTINPDIEIKSLQPNTRYEYQVSATCGILESTFSPVASITTKSNPPIVYSCGVPLSPFNLDPSQLLDVLKVGDIIQAGDFDVTITKVTGGSGNFSGEGVIPVSYFNQAKVKAEFSGITVNKEMRMVNGYMNITGAGVDVIPSGVINFMDKLSESLAFLDSALTKYEENLPKRFDPTVFVADKAIVIPGAIVSVTPATDGSGAVVIVDDKGNKQTIPAGTSAAITDSKGKGYLVDKQGGIHQTTAAIAAKAGKREYNFAVKFAGDNDQAFGFDELGTKSALAGTYDKLDGKYDVAWKSVAAGQTDKVQAIVEGSGIDKSKVHFEQFGHVLTPNTSGTNAFSLNVQGKIDGTTEGLVAIYTPADTTKKEQVLGQLNVVTYNEIPKTVVIVPVNDSDGSRLKKVGDKTTLQTELNKIYGQAVTKWSVNFADNITVPSIEPFEDGGSGLLSNYTSHMRQVISAYKANMQPNTYYLFLVSNPKEPNTLGVMPRSKESGFIFVDKHANAAAIARTMAHELGHGAFNLHHTFMEPKLTQAKGTTDNLMDYPSGDKLYKYQWDKMRYPDIVVGLFESDDEGKNRVGDGIDLLGNIITEVIYDKPDKILVGVLSEQKPYLRTGYSEYNTLDKTLITSYTAIIENGKVVYKDASNNVMPYIVKTSSSGFATISILNDGCTVNRATISGWVKPSSPELVIDEIKNIIAKENPSWEVVNLYKQDPSCFIINSLASLIRKDADGNYCTPDKISNDVLKLNAMFSKSFTNEEIAKLVCDQGVCLSALRQMSWSNLSKAIKQLGNTNEYTWERREITILRLMAAINSSNYKDFIALLEEENNKLILNLISKIQDKSINPWDGNNFTSFIGGLCAIYNLKPEIWQSRIKPFENVDLLGQIVSLAPFKFSAPSMGTLVDILMPSLGEAKFEGALTDANKIEITRHVKYLVGSGSPSSPNTGNISLPTWVKDDDFDPVKLEPLDPIIILTKSNLPLVETAISGLEPIGENLYLVPAIFLQFKTQKEVNDAIEKGAMITLDVVTIATSGGAALATKVTWARRLWAITEVVAAGSNIAINTGNIDPESNYGKVVNAYNIVMGVIGLKNAAKGLKNVVKNIPDYVKTAIQNKQSLKSFLSIQVQTFKKYLADLKKPGGGWDNLDDASRQKLNQQEEFVEFLDNPENLPGSGAPIATGKVSRTLDELAPNGKIPKNTEFNKWFDDLNEEELSSVWNDDKIRTQIENEIRKPGGLHEWCMVCEVEQFKKWGVKMEDIKNFRTKTTELVGTNPYDGTPFAHSVLNSEGKIIPGPSSKTFHNELQSIISSSNNITEFNSRLMQLVEKWKIDPKLLPPFIK